MENLTEQELEHACLNIIENSFLNAEKESFYSSLKTLKISQQELIPLFLELVYFNHGEVKAEIVDLPKKPLLTKITNLIGTGDIKYLDAFTTLHNHINSIFTIIGQHLEKNDEDLYKKSITTLNENKELIRDRFNYDETQKNNVILIEENFKGQHSFTLIKQNKTDVFLKIINELKNNDLVVSETSAERFKTIFSGTKIPNKEKVNWEGTKYELSLFLKFLRPKFITDEYIYQTAIRCFTVKGKEIIKTTEISNSSGKTSKGKIIKEIVSNF